MSAPEQIEMHAKRFRRAIERCDRRGNPVLKNFPHGSCGDASRLFETFLMENGFSELEHVFGKSKDVPTGLPSHAWTEWRGIIIDITGDQFVDSPAPPVLVTTDRTWHRRFREEERDAAGIDLFGGYTTALLREWYRRIVDCLDDEAV
jgi:hypothetical protein